MRRLGDPLLPGRKFSSPWEWADAEVLARQEHLAGEWVPWLDDAEREALAARAEGESQLLLCGPWAVRAGALIGLLDRFEMVACADEGRDEKVTVRAGQAIVAAYAVAVAARDVADLGPATPARLRRAGERTAALVDALRNGRTPRSVIDAR